MRAIINMVFETDGDYRIENYENYNLNVGNENYSGTVIFDDDSQINLVAKVKNYLQDIYDNCKTNNIIMKEELNNSLGKVINNIDKNNLDFSNHYEAYLFGNYDGTIIEVDFVDNNNDLNLYSFSLEIEKAINHLENATKSISSVKKSIYKNTNISFNKDIIKKLNDITFLLEELKDEPIIK